jgi:hypothetical protein
MTLIYPLIIVFFVCLGAYIGSLCGESDPTTIQNY